MRELEDIAGSDVWGFTIPSPVMEPISLRAFPIDLLGMPMYHVIGLPLPRRVAVHVGPDGKLLHILQKLGISSACQASGTLCFLEVPSSDGTRFWYIDQAVDELHGTSMLLRMTVQECRPGQIRSRDHLFGKGRRECAFPACASSKDVGSSPGL